VIATAGLQLLALGALLFAAPAGGGRERPAAAAAHDVHLSHARVVVEGATVVMRVRIFKDDLERALGARLGRAGYVISPGHEADSLVVAYLNEAVTLTHGAADGEAVHVLLRRGRRRGPHDPLVAPGRVTLRPRRGGPRGGRRRRDEDTVRLLPVHLHSRHPRRPGGDDRARARRCPSGRRRAGPPWGRARRLRAGGSALATVAGLGLAAVTREERPLLMLPLGQIAMASWMERRTAR
jgi:hypothetical protein